MSIRFLSNPVGRKQLMALTGLGWCLFVFLHMTGNLLYLLGDEAFNVHGHSITGNKEFYYAAETGLVLMLSLHVLFAVLVVRANRAARPVAYAVAQGKSVKSAASLASRSMALSGMLVLAFLIAHLTHFRFGAEYLVTVKGQEIRDLARLMREFFQSTLHVGGYLFLLFVLSFHLRHALWSSLQTLGWIPGGKEGCARSASDWFGILVAVGFALNPIFIFLFQRGAQ